MRLKPMVSFDLSSGSPTGTWVSSIAGAGALVAESELPDSHYIAGGGDVDARVAINQHEIGAEAFGDATPVVEAEGASRFKGGGGQRVERCQTGSDQQLQLTMDA